MVGKNSKQLIGIALYWAEGSKEKEYRAGSGVIFSNSDPKMIKLYVNWLTETLGVTLSRIAFELYVHKNRKRDEKKIKDFWAHELGYPLKFFGRIYYKRHNPKTKRHNKGNLYHGLIRVKVVASSMLLRQIDGWISGIIKHCGIV